MSYISGGESKLIQIVQVETVTLPSLMISLVIPDGLCRGRRRKSTLDITAASGNEERQPCRFSSVTLKMAPYAPLGLQRDSVHGEVG